MSKKNKNEFGRNVLLLLTGTIIAQAIPIAISPILTRIYGPEDFGLFALYIGLLTTFSVIISARYEQAILFPSSDKDAFNLIILSISIAAFISGILFLCILIFGKNIAEALGSNNLKPLLYLLPFSLLFSGAYQALSYWLNRKKEYSSLAKARIQQNGSISGIQLVGGLGASSSMMLVLGDFIGRVVSLAYIFKKAKGDFFDFKEISKSKQIELAKTYKKYPIFDFWGSLANSMSYQVQNILFPLFYGFVSAGYYFLVMRVLNAPLSIISSSITDVFKQIVADPDVCANQKKKFFLRMMFFLILTGMPFLVIFIVYAEDGFAFVFGEDWRLAGVYAVMLAPMFYIRFIASPLSYFLYVKNKQHIDMIGNIVFLTVGVLSVVLVDSIIQTIELIVLGYSTLYVFYIIYSSYLAGVFTK